MSLTWSQCYSTWRQRVDQIAPQFKAGITIEDVTPSTSERWEPCNYVWVSPEFMESWIRQGKNLGWFPPGTKGGQLTLRMLHSYEGDLESQAAVLIYAVMWDMTHRAAPDEWRARGITKLIHEVDEVVRLQKLNATWYRNGEFVGRDNPPTPKAPFWIYDDKMTQTLPSGIGWHQFAQFVQPETHSDVIELAVIASALAFASHTPLRFFLP